jgi:soluble lytic murein transglycosylase-like protein
MGRAGRRAPARLLLAFGLAGLGLAPSATAQIYTRVNRDGVIEATNIPAARGFRLIYPGKGTLIHSRGFRGAYRGEFDHHIQAAAAAHGVSMDLIRAVIQVESAFDRLAVSSKGAKGLMQLMPDTARRMGVFDVFDPRQNVMGGARYLRLLLDLFGGNIPLALAAYNAGENAVRRYGGIPPYKETRGYVRKVQALLADVGHSAVISFPAARRRGAGLGLAGGGGRPEVSPARPAVYYQWRDQEGRQHVAEEPPAEGTRYSMIRALP